MKKRGQISFKVVFSIIIALVVLIVLFLSFNSVRDVSKKATSVEIINLEKSIQTKILQQSVKTKGSLVNVSFAVPSSIQRLCFFDSNKKYDTLRNPEITGLYSDDKVNNLFILTDDGFFPYNLGELDIDEADNPLCVKIENSRILLQLVSGEKKTQILASQDNQEVKCVSVFENGDPDKKIDVVFLGYGFEDVDQYNDQVNRYVNNVLLEFEPFKEYREKFNFYRVDDAKVECNIGDFIQCDQFEIKVAASDCPNDYIVLLVDRSAINDFIKPVRSSAISNIAKINTADKPFVIVHELGHSFADLADEYVDASYYSDSNFNALEYPNCDSSPCSSWQNVGNTSCYEGCSLKKYFRPTRESVMRTLNSPTYGPVNEREILKRLLYYE